MQPYFVFLPSTTKVYQTPKDSKIHQHAGAAVVVGFWDGNGGLETQMSQVLGALFFFLLFSLIFITSKLILQVP